MLATYIWEEQLFRNVLIIMNEVITLPSDILQGQNQF